jgi:hypothetical protein
MTTEVSEDLKRVLHARALRWLHGHLRAQRNKAAAGRITQDDPEIEAATDGRIIAMEHAGAISSKEAAIWRERLRQAATWRDPVRTTQEPAVRDRAIAHLDELVTPVSPTSPEASRPCFSALAAYEATGIFTPEEALGWREQLRALMDLEPERPPRCTRHNLRRVVAGPPLRRRGLRITSVELYADGVVLQWHHARRWMEGPETPRIWSDFDIEMATTDELGEVSLTDNVGTLYQGGGAPELGVKGGGSIVHFGSASFTPAVPPDAWRLKARIRDDEIDVDLWTP